MSEPTDLIREIDARHQPISPAIMYCQACGTRWPCGVRRLRDAYAASRDEVAAMSDLAALYTDKAERLTTERDEARAALAEAREVTGGMAFSSWLEDQRAALAGAQAEVERLRQVCRDHRVRETWVLGVDPNHEHVHIALRGGRK